MLRWVEAASRVRHLHRKAVCRVGYFWHHRERKQCEIRGQSKSACCFYSLLHILTTLMLSSTLQCQQTQRENRFISSFSGTYLHCKSFKQKKSHCRAQQCGKNSRSSWSTVQRVSQYKGKISQPGGKPEKLRVFRASTSRSLRLSQQAKGVAHLNE